MITDTFRILFVFTALFACAPVALQAENFADSIQSVQKMALWKEKPALKASMTILFGGKERFSGTIVMTPISNMVRLERADGAVAVFDGKNAWVSGKTDWPRARFDVLTWAYFWAAPYKLTDPGTILESTGKAKLQVKEYDTARMTFAAGIGDAPDDWYVLYRDPDTRRLAAMAYIVTFGKTREEAEKEPHAIVYEDFQEVNGIPMPMHWTFWKWTKANGIIGDALGEIRLRDVTFPELKSISFAKPEGAVEAAMPKK